MPPRSYIEAMDRPTVLILLYIYIYYTIQRQRTGVSYDIMSCRLRCLMTQ